MSVTDSLITWTQKVYQQKNYTFEGKSGSYLKKEKKQQWRKKVFQIEHLKPNPFLVTQKKMQRQMFNLKYMITWHSCFIYTLKQIWVSKSIHYEILIYWKPDRQGICSDHRSFNILSIFFLSGLWFYTFFIITRESCDHDIIITFLFKTQKCWYHWKDITLFFNSVPVMLMILNLSFKCCLGVV